jgi:hypothetical protein
MQKIIFFTAGEVATTNEKNAIAALQAAIEPAYDLTVASAIVPANYGNDPSGDPILENADYVAVAGTVPTAYNALPTLAVTAIPNPNDPLQAMVRNAQVLTVGGATYTFTVAAGVITGIVVS